MPVFTHSKKTPTRILLLFVALKIVPIREQCLRISNNDHFTAEDIGKPNIRSQLIIFVGFECCFDKRASRIMIVLLRGQKFVIEKLYPTCLIFFVVFENCLGKVFQMDVKGLKL